MKRKNEKTPPRCRERAKRIPRLGNALRGAVRRRHAPARKSALDRGVPIAR
ncbi:hypothetical protein BRCON_2530 [Candidatus Sumerlaea chitinivorans]|uniref:Uncharacterized protein n=1 Tax=Sumerlaea chitinivorans TaxID=2250252 RepID=A0A2Z4Y9E5_SUMC1|nr:hypothetical protein BRCON_2530 [Candidatus Sumerlaea chitinivorans]